MIPISNWSIPILNILLLSIVYLLPILIMMSLQFDMLFNSFEEQNIIAGIIEHALFQCY